MIATLNTQKPVLKASGVFTVGVGLLASVSKNVVSVPISKLLENEHEWKACVAASDLSLISKSLSTIRVVYSYR